MNAAARLDCLDLPDRCKKERELSATHLHINLIQDIFRFIVPNDLRDADALTRALEFTGSRVKEITDEARGRKCFFCKSERDRSNGIISLRFSDGASVSFRRTVNCNSFFKASGLYSDFASARILAEVDALVFASGEFQEYRIAVNARRMKRHH